MPNPSQTSDKRPDLNEVLSTLYAVREQVAANTKRLIALEQTVSVMATEQSKKQNIYPEVTQREATHALAQQIADIKTTSMSLQNQLDLLARTNAIKLAELGVKFQTLDYLLATDPYKITKAKLIKIAKELKL